MDFDLDITFSDFIYNIFLDVGFLSYGNYLFFSLNFFFFFLKFVLFIIINFFIDEKEKPLKNSKGTKKIIILSLTGWKTSDYNFKRRKLIPGFNASFSI